MLNEIIPDIRKWSRPDQARTAGALLCGGLVEMLRDSSTPSYREIYCATERHRVIWEQIAMDVFRGWVKRRSALVERYPMTDSVCKLVVES